MDAAAPETPPEMQSAPCPCGWGSPYRACCGELHAGKAAPTAAQLMRSRYSAFALGLREYLLRSWHSRTRPDEAEFALDPDLRWLRLLVDEVSAGGPFDAEGTVAFTAIGCGPDGRFEQRERSRFVREDGRWVYLDGVG